MLTKIVLIIPVLCAVVAAFPPEIEQLKNDFVLMGRNATSKNRLSAWIVLGPNNKRCNMVRPTIKSFGFCWKDENEQQGINTATYRGYVREIVKQWEKCGGIKIQEESKCRMGPDFVTIQVGNYHPMVNPYIDEKTCVISGFTMYLNFYTFGINTESYRRTEKIRESNIKMYALHEFGHFLGLDHEHNRKDRRDSCTTPVDETEVGAGATYGNEYITSEYDLDSVMNYCRSQVWYKPWLSELDKRGIWQAYGGSDWNACQAATKPWMWGPGDGLYPEVLAELEKQGFGQGSGTGNGNGNGNTNTTPAPVPDTCADTVNWCSSFLDSCDDDSNVKRSCRKSCGLCDGCKDQVDWCYSYKGRCKEDKNVKRNCRRTCGAC